MFYLAGNKLYATAAAGHGKRYAEMELRMVDGDKTMIETGGGVDALPPGAFPMTYTECMAVLAPMPEHTGKPRKKGGAKDATDV